MSKIRKQYGRGFKAMAVGPGKVGLPAKEPEARPALLYCWRREPETKPGTSFPGQGKTIYAPGQAGTHRLKKGLPGMQQGRGISKKAVGLFSRGEGKFLGS